MTIKYWREESLNCSHLSWETPHSGNKSNYPSPNYITRLYPRFFNFEEKYFAYSKSKDGEVSCDVDVQQVLFPAGLALPQFSQLPHCTGQVPSSMARQENFWYEQARHLLASQYFKHLQQRKYARIPQLRERDQVSHIEFLYGTEENFLNTKIYPNITGASNRPNCSGISRLNNSPSSSSKQQTAFVGFYGSGNHMLM